MTTYKPILPAQQYFISGAAPNITQIQQMDEDTKPTFFRYNISFPASLKNHQNDPPELQKTTTEELPMPGQFHHSELQMGWLHTEKMLSIIGISSPIFLVVLLRLLYIRFLYTWQDKGSSKEQSHNNYTQQLELPVSYEKLQEKYEEAIQKNQVLQQLLTEKECMLKEIHHRVKNNLQVVMSLLNSQADFLEDNVALSAIQESQHRVRVISLIHQKLYQSEGVARIPMHDYIGEVVAYLHKSYCLHHTVRFEVQVEPIELDVTQAVPLGLIINEVITNAFKYAFPDGRPGTVRLSLHRLAKTTYQFTIADNGVGLPSHYDPSQSPSLGMTLLHGFSSQLGGELTITNTSPSGLTIDLVFQEEQLTPSCAPVAHG
jgi:two-component sensor histidine kinase